MNRQNILTTSIICLLTIWAPAEAQNFRAATASSYIERGNKRFAKGEFERALADYDLAVASDPGNARAYHNRAITRYQLKDYERALADFGRAIELDPRFVEAYVDRGGVRYLMGDLDGAISDCNKPSN